MPEAPGDEGASASRRHASGARAGVGDRRPWEPDRRPGRRLFVAVPLAGSAREPIETVVRAVIDAAPFSPERNRGRAPVRWVRLDGLHLTLRFLGPTLEPAVAGVRAAVRAAAAGAAPFTVRIAGGGAFPTPERPRTIWLGVVEGANDLAALARRVDEAVVPLGWPPEERPFRGHLTLARCEPGPAAVAAVGRLEEAARGLDVSWTADEVVLFESHTGSGPARYEALERAPLRG